MKSFTLIEVIVVMAIVSVLALTVYVAVNPSKQINSSLDRRRSIDISSIIDAIHQYTVDHQGNLPTELAADGVEKQLGSALTGCAISTGNCNVEGDTDCLNLGSILSPYLGSIPIDPDGGTSSLTKYSLMVNQSGLITVKACNAYNPPIYVSK